jgi:hypothetical protein
MARLQPIGICCYCGDECNAAIRGCRPCSRGLTGWRIGLNRYPERVRDLPFDVDVEESKGCFEFKEDCWIGDLKDVYPAIGWEKLELKKLAYYRFNGYDTMGIPFHGKFFAWQCEIGMYSIIEGHNIKNASGCMAVIPRDLFNRLGVDKNYSGGEYLLFKPEMSGDGGVNPDGTITWGDNRMTFVSLLDY